MKGSNVASYLHVKYYLFNTIGSQWPADVVQAEGFDAIFLCQLPNINGVSIEWQINGTSWLKFNDSVNGPIRREGRGNNTEALIIPATPHFNKSWVVCTMYIIGVNQTDFIDSSPATLVVQGCKINFLIKMILYIICKLDFDLLGPLEAIDSLQRQSTSSRISLSWKPPFSLNLTTAEPDVVYCVEIYDMDREHLNSSCIFELQYNLTVESPDPRDIFQFTVTPRSNVQGAIDGTPSHINGSFSFESE